MRLEVREDRDTIHEVRHVESWPPPGVRWTELYLGSDGRLSAEAPAAGEVDFATADGRATWAWRVPRDLELSGPTTGWMKLSHRDRDAGLSRPFSPVNRDDSPRPLGPGEVAEVEFGLGPSATFFRAGEEIRLVLGGRWMHPTDPITGQFPAKYEASPDCTVRIACGGSPAARLLVPLIEID